MPDLADDEIIEIIVKIKNIIGSKSLSVAESCSGGMLASYITSIAGAAAFFKGGIVSYTNQTKINLLGVDKKLIDSYGAVSEKVALEMALRCAKIFHSDFAISITGLAGPGGDDSEQPIGTVFIAGCYNEILKVCRVQLEGSRRQIRKKSCLAALQLISQLM